MMNSRSCDAHLAATCGQTPPPDLLALLEEQDDFLLLGHVNPDGDAVGSVLALAHMLRDMGRTVSAAFPSPPPRWWTDMPGADLVQDNPRQASVVIALDCDGAGRLAGLQPLHSAAQYSAEIDHHSSTDRTSDILYVDPAAGATGVLVFRIIEALDRPLTSASATCIYWAVATDTGFFRFANTSTEVLEVCARCAACGADPHFIAHTNVGIRPLPHLILKGRALAGLESYLDGRVLASAIGPEDFVAAGADRTHVEEIIDDIRLAENVDVYVLFKAIASDNRWEVSLRSSVANCAQIARGFGGGGHAEAAGFTFDGPLEEGRTRLLDSLSKALPDHHHA